MIITTLIIIKEEIILLTKKSLCLPNMEHTQLETWKQDQFVNKKEVNMVVVTRGVVDEKKNTVVKVGFLLWWIALELTPLNNTRQNLHWIDNGFRQTRRTHGWRSEDKAFNLYEMRTFIIYFPCRRWTFFGSFSESTSNEWKKKIRYHTQIKFIYFSH